MTVLSSISLTDDRHDFVETLEPLEQAVLAEILGRRRSGPFWSAAKMDARLSRMIDKKRRAHAVRD